MGSVQFVVGTWMNGEGQFIEESDARAMVRLVGDIAALRAPMPGKKRALMAGLCKLVDADAWAWIVSRAADEHSNPAVAAFLYDGLTPRQFTAYVSLMQDRAHPPVEYHALNELRRKLGRFTRSWDQLVSPEQWYGPLNQRLIHELGFEHVLYSVRILDDDGLFSGIALMRRLGRTNFNPRQRRIVHIVLGEVDWLHFDLQFSNQTREVRRLSPRLRMVLTLLVDGKSVKQAAHSLSLSDHTVNDYAKDLYRHFNIHTRAELLRHFMVGDGGDIG
ncbi:MAG: LuxR C-terminal-related transcriptional regulator [Tepidisphaeraceae bacterium]